MSLQQGSENIRPIDTVKETILLFEPALADETDHALLTCQSRPSGACWVAL
jgi:hypothetical protein